MPDTPRRQTISSAGGGHTAANRTRFPPRPESALTTGVRIILNHIDAVVRPALRNYLSAEKALTDAVLKKDATANIEARQNVMLAARQATDVLHHLSDFVLKEPTPALIFTKIDGVRAAVETKCVFLRSGKPVADVKLLRDVADAFKHHRPDRPTTVQISTDVVSHGSGFGEMHFGEGKYGGVEQVVVTLKTGDKRALSSILQNVFDAWMSLLGQPLLPISEY
jgi:hypothetical protein